MRYGIWAPVTVRYCVAAGSATSEKRWGEAGQSARQVDTGMRDKIVVGDDQYDSVAASEFCSRSQAAICQRGQAAIMISTMCNGAV